MANDRAWGDIYNIGRMKEYVHTNPENFMNQYRSNLSSIDDAYKHFFRIMRIFLQDHINYWKKLESGLISEAKNQGVIESTMSSREFIIEYNSQFAALRKEGNLSWQFFEFKNIANEFTGKQDNVRKAKTKGGKALSAGRMADNMTKNLEPILKAMTAIYNAEYDIHYRWADFMGYSPAVMKEILPNITAAKKGISEIFKMLKIDGVAQGDTLEFDKILSILNGYKENIQPLNSKGKAVGSDVLTKFYTLATRSHMEKFLTGKNWGTGMLGTLGRALEDSEAVRIAEDRMLRGNVDKGQAIDYLKEINVGEFMKMDSVTDTIHFKYELGGKTVSAGVSDKLTKAPGVLNKEYSSKDALENPYIQSKFTGIGIGTKGSVLDIIYWLRSNMQALQYTKIYTKDGGGSDFSFAESKKFFKYEKEVAGLLGIPRLLDGVYEYSKDQLGNRDVKGGVV